MLSKEDEWVTNHHKKWSLKLFIFRKIQIKIAMRYFYILINMDKIETNKNNQQYQVLLRILLNESKNTSHLLLWKCKLIKPLWNRVDVYLAWDPPIPLLHIYSREMKTYVQIKPVYESLFEASFLMSHPKCPSTGE